MAVNWTTFDADKYVAENYLQVAPEDEHILKRLGEQHVAVIGEQRHTIEVGVGPNLYPVMAASVSSKHVTLLEYSANNIAYLHRQIDELSPHWLAFWERLVALDRRYGEIDFQTYLQNSVTVTHGNIFDWANPNDGQFDTVSSHFCIESITSDPDEFATGLECLLNLTRPGGLLVAGFLRESSGYSVGCASFPAFPVTGRLLHDSLSAAGFGSIEIAEIPNSGELAKDHEWSGMLHVAAIR